MPHIDSLPPIWGEGRKKKDHYDVAASVKYGIASFFELV